jgi:plasmid stability protein
MLHLEINETLAARLRQRAAEVQQSIETVAVDVLTQTVLEQHDVPLTNPLLLLAQMSEELDLRSGRSDISENFDVVMDTLISEEMKRQPGDVDGNAANSP